jgi:hypothetical protein
MGTSSLAMTICCVRLRLHRQRDIRRSLGGGAGHIFMILLSSPNQSKIVVASLAEGLS